MAEKTAMELAMEGARRALDHANAVEQNWGDLAFQFFKLYAQAHTLFQTEDVRVWSYKNGLPHAPDGRAWGAIALEAKRAKIIVCDSYANTKVKPAHAAPRAVWKSLIMGGVEVVS